MCLLSVSRAWGAPSLARPQSSPYEKLVRRGEWWEGAKSSQHPIRRVSPSPQDARILIVVWETAGDESGCTECIRCNECIGSMYIPNRTFLVRFGGISGEFGRAKYAWRDFHHLTLPPPFSCGKFVEKTVQCYHFWIVLKTSFETTAIDRVGDATHLVQQPRFWHEI